MFNRKIRSRSGKTGLNLIRYKNDTVFYKSGDVLHETF